MIATRSSAEYPQHRAGDDLVPLEDLIAQASGAHPIRSIDELRCDTFDTDEELDEFLAFFTEPRHPDVAELEAILSER